MKGRLAVVAVLSTIVGALLMAPTAGALRSVAGPTWFSCGTYTARTLHIGPPRAWASYGTEQVVWLVGIQRYNGSRWYAYDTFRTWTSFNYYGQGVTYWSGGYFHNNRLNLRVSHPGYYRVNSVIGGTQGGQRWSGFLMGGDYCYMR